MLGVISLMKPFRQVPESMHSIAGAIPSIVPHYCTLLHTFEQLYNIRPHSEGWNTLRGLQQSFLHSFVVCCDSIVHMPFNMGVDGTSKLINARRTYPFEPMELPALHRDRWPLVSCSHNWQLMKWTLIYGAWSPNHRRTDIDLGRCWTSGSPPPCGYHLSLWMHRIE